MSANAIRGADADVGHSAPPIEIGDPEIEERLRRARRAGEPLWLWPRVPRAAWRAALIEIERVLRADLADGALPPLRAATPELARALAVAAFTSGTGPLLGRWIEERRLEATPALGSHLLDHLDHGRRRWERLRVRAAEAVEQLTDAGVPTILLKGIHTGPAFFPEPGCRPSSDVDLAVPEERWAQAVAALERAGYRVEARQGRMRRAELRPPHEGRSIRSLELLHADAPIGIDVHAGIERETEGGGRPPFGAVRPGETAPWPLVHPSARVLAEPLLVATLAAHSSEDLPRLSLLRVYELARILRLEVGAGALDWAEILTRVPRPGYRFLFPSLELVERLAPGTVPLAVREALRVEVPLALRSAVAGLAPAAAQRFDGLTLEERLMWAGNAREIFGRALNVAWPASAGGSWRRVARIYAERFWKLARGGGSFSR
jgi:hypothetical protein